MCDKGFPIHLSFHTNDVSILDEHTVDTRSSAQVTASRDGLIQIILQQHARLAELEQQLARQQTELATLRATIRQLTRRLGEATDAAPPPTDPPAASNSSRPTTMPGLKPPGTRPPRATTPRKRRPHGFARQRMTPTARQVHAVAACPACGSPLAGGTIVHTREVIDLPVAPITVTEHVSVERRCPCCQHQHRPLLELAGVVVGQSRLGVRLVSLIATLREVGRLPIRVIQEVLAAVWGLELSVGGLIDALRQVAQRATPLVAEILACIRGSPVVHADESGWREDGVNGYIWTISTPTARYFMRRSREKEAIDEALGEAFGGVLVTDFYAAYDHHLGVKQRCWQHLLTDIKDWCKKHPKDVGVQGWAMVVRAIWARASEACPLPAYRVAHQRAYEQELRAVCAPYLGEEETRRRRCCAAGSRSTWRSCSCSWATRRCRRPTTRPSAACGRR